jgi:hypothetical protein
VLVPRRLHQRRGRRDGEDAARRDCAEDLTINSAAVSASRRTRSAGAVFQRGASSDQMARWTFTTLLKPASPRSQGVASFVHVVLRYFDGSAA